jgi:DNA-directed RNA polymerase subunit M/transcription elongation factor TFIIS
MQKTEYERKVLQIAWNLLQNGQLLLRKYAPSTLVYLDNSLLAEDTPVEHWWTTHNKQIELEKVLLNEEAAFDETEQLANSGLTCNRCHSRLIAIQQQQIRSADEGMTVFCTCKKCGMRWKM